MSLLNAADKLYVGSTPVDRVYAGANLAWEAGGVEPPVTGPDARLITSFTPGGDRNDFTGQVGVRLGIGTSNMLVSWCGIRRHHTDGPRTVHLYEWFADALQWSVTIDLTGHADGEFVWKAIAPYTLLANGYYALMMDCTQGDGKIWTNPGPVTMPSIVNIYDTYRVAAGPLQTGMSGAMFVGLDLGW